MKLDAQSQAVTDALNASGVLPLRQYDPLEAREKLLAVRVPRPPAAEMWKVTEETITTPDGSFTVRIHWPREPKAGEQFGGVLYFHGGGFFAGGLEETDHLVRQIAADADTVVINVDYHLSPEAKFPVAVNDAYAALCWAVEHAARLHVDPDRLVLAGDSAGGNLTIVVCLMAQEQGGPAIKLQVPIYPSLDLQASPQYESRLKWGGGEYFLTNGDIEWMLDHYFSDRKEGGDWRASPILAESYAGLPPALVVTASHDPLVDEGKLYADRLTEAGVAAEYACFDGTIHGFVSMAIAIDSGARAMELICARIRQAVSR